MFDFNGDGKVDAGEFVTGMFILEEMEKGSSGGGGGNNNGGGTGCGCLTFIVVILIILSFASCLA